MDAQYTVLSGGRLSDVGGMGAGQALNAKQLAVQQQAESASLVRDKVGEVENVVSDLHGLIDTLYRRLESVMPPQMPAPPSGAATGSGQPAPPRLGGSHLYGRVDEIRQAITAACRKIDWLMQQIEL